MDETDRPDDRRAAGSWVLPNSESRRQRNHEAAKSGIQKRKKTRTYPRLSCKIEYLLTSNHSDGSIASEFFTGDYVRPMHGVWVEMPAASSSHDGVKGAVFLEFGTRAPCGFQKIA